MKKLLVFLLITSLLMPASLFAAESREKLKAFIQGMNRASAEKRLNDAYNKSPYEQYDREYRYLYQTGQISRKDYLDRMMELKTLEMNRKRELTNSLVNYTVARRLNQNSRPKTYHIQSLSGDGSVVTVDEI